jgi:hypothetical protein
LVGAYVHAGLYPPRMLSKAVVGSTVEVTFNQSVKLSVTTPDMGVPGNSKAGFTVIDNGVAEVPVTAISVAGAKATLTVGSVANLTGSWFVRNGLQLTGTLGSTGDPVSYMPRTLVVGLTNVGTAEDGTILENFSIPQEI